MKKILNTLFIACLTLVSCHEKEAEYKVIAVDSITLDKTELTLTEGDNADLIATVLPENAFNKGIKWSSSDESVATVSGGTVTARKEGTAVISVTTDEGGKTVSCVVKVEAKIIYSTKVSFNKKSIKLMVGDTDCLTFEYYPENSVNEGAHTTNSDESVATYGDAGVVTACKVGTAVISLTVKAGPKTLTDECVITVIPKVYPVEGIVLNKTELTMHEGDTETLAATVLPDNATDKIVTFSSANPAVASVMGSKVTAVKVGSTVITAKAGDKTAECKVTVTAPVVEVTSFSLDRPLLVLKPEETDELVPGSFYPTNATDKTGTWSIADPTIASVENGKVTALKGGATTLTVKIGKKEQTANIYVIEEVVDLGLTVKWRGWNLGAENPREKGDYYAWGEVETYYSSLDPVKWKTGKEKGYNMESYKFRTAGYTANEDGTGDLKVSKYNSVEGHGTIDGKTVLDPEDDAANVILGNGWRMPTRMECEQLLSSRCKNEYINDKKGVQGRLFTGPSGKVIFFEITGYYFNKYVQDDTYILLWTSNLYDNYVPQSAYTFHMIGSNIGLSSAMRSHGRVIRPVKE